MAPSLSLFFAVSNVLFPVLDLAVGGSMIFYGVISYNTRTFEGMVLPVHVGCFGLIIIAMTLV